MSIQMFETDDQMEDAFDKYMENEQLKTVKPVARFDYSLEVDCPKCGVEIELIDYDDGTYSEPLLNNRWDEIKDMDAVCSNCEWEFKLGGVIY